MVTPAARREAVAHLQIAYEVSERRACSALGADRTSVRYRSHRPDDTAARARLRELPIVYILILWMALLWRRAVLGNEDLTLFRIDGIVILFMSWNSCRG